jgi:hypothetical protein
MRHGKYELIINDVRAYLEEAEFLASPDNLGGDATTEPIVAGEGGAVQVDDGECDAVVVEALAVELQGGTLLRREDVPGRHGGVRRGVAQQLHL